MEDVLLNNEKLLPSSNSKVQPKKLEEPELGAENQTFGNLRQPELGLVQPLIKTRHSVT